MDKTFASVLGKFTEWTEWVAIMQARPCLDCGTTGGPLKANPHKPWRARVELTRPRPAPPWGATSTQEWHASIARDAARTWSSAEWVERTQAA